VLANPATIKPASGPPKMSTIYSVFAPSSYMPLGLVSIVNDYTPSRPIALATSNRFR
jgi:hypothetical protein